MPTLTFTHAVQAIAKAYAAGAPDQARMIDFAARQIEAPPALLSLLAADVLAHFGARVVVAHHATLAGFLMTHPALLQIFGVFGDLGELREDDEEIDDADKVDSDAAVDSSSPPRRLSFIAAPVIARPVLWPILASPLPAIASTTDLCALLDIHPQQLDAWTRRWRPSTAPDAATTMRRHAYFSYWQPKPRGGARLIEMPKPGLKQAQRRLLRRVVERLSPHEASTGFSRGNSIVGHAARHSGQELVLKCDLKDFFLSIRLRRVHSVFRHMGYDESVARALAALVTTRTPAIRLQEGKMYAVDFLSAQSYRADHLPQGAPTSPALANLAAFNLDLRMESLADSAGIRYSRYADDLTFSGARNSGIGNARFYHRICAIAIDEGFDINTRKTRLMGQGVRQHVTGLVVNGATNVPREEFDRLKAILTNAARHGLATQNREGVAHFSAHLQGRIAFVAQTNARRGEALRALWRTVVATNRAD